LTKPLATHGRTIHVGQKAKYLQRADVFRFSSNIRHCPMQLTQSVSETRIGDSVKQRQRIRRQAGTHVGIVLSDQFARMVTVVDVSEASSSTI
jgi:hypothetical protein